MKNATLAVVLLPTLMFAGCFGSDPQKDKVVTVGAQMICLAQEGKALMEELQKEAANDMAAMGEEGAETGTGTSLEDQQAKYKEYEEKGKALQAKAEKIFTDNGFKDANEFDSIQKKYTEEELKKLISEKAKSTCGMTVEQAEELFKSM